MKLFAFLLLLIPALILAQETAGIPENPRVSPELCSFNYVPLFSSIRHYDRL